MFENLKRAAAIGVLATELSKPVEAADWAREVSQGLQTLLRESMRYKTEQNRQRGMLLRDQIRAMERVMVEGIRRDSNNYSTLKQYETEIANINAALDEAGLKAQIDLAALMAANGLQNLSTGINRTPDGKVSGLEVKGNKFTGKRNIIEIVKENGKEYRYIYDDAGKLTVEEKK